MYGALKWATIQLMGLADVSAVRPRCVAAWLTAVYAIFGILFAVICGLLQWLFGFAPVLAALISTASYVLLTWRVLPVSRGGEYLLMLRLVTASDSQDYDAYRRQAVYLSLLGGRLVAIFILNLYLGSAWMVPVVLLSGCFVIEAVNQSIGSVHPRVFSCASWSHWLIGGGITLLYGGLCGLWQGRGGILVLSLLACVLSLSIAVQARYLGLEDLPLLARRRFYWAVAELGLLAVGLMGLMV